MRVPRVNQGSQLGAGVAIGVAAVTHVEPLLEVGAQRAGHGQKERGRQVAVELLAVDACDRDVAEPQAELVRQRGLASLAKSEDPHVLTLRQQPGNGLQLG